ncbi:uncharacterized protein LOC128033827 [Gossypium raimondii]|uniref:uncharacterized protein LOC128033827 n=1 Tax=Gossypium raimondii TaxID=29730 RepID=UPI00227AB893|nr:uncharacterized protein LOC128033827 [Gossypium raimondii]
MYSFEKKGGQVREEKGMEAFRDVLGECQLIDVGYTGVWYTWERGNLPSTNIRERLDRGVANEKWMESFSCRNVHHLTSSLSDHCPLLVSTTNGGRLKRTPRFKFEAWWTAEESIEEEIRKSWEALNGSLVGKFESLQISLSKWAQSIRRTRKELTHKFSKELESLLEKDRDNDTMIQLINARTHLNLEIDKEEMYWEQRARANWLQLGDRNTTFFHKFALMRKRVNAVHRLDTDDGNEIVEETEIIETAAKHIVGKDIEEFCLGVLNDGKTLGDFNFTEIVLIPKIPNPTNLVNFRSISLCTIIYKIVAKVIANHLQEFIGGCIDNAQSAFIPGRTAIAEGLIKGVKASRRGPAISHLLFADDCILFSEATKDKTRTLKDILKEYERCSGQCVNFSKSTVFFSSNMMEGDKAAISTELGIRRSTNMEKYLGLPNMVGMRKKESFQNLKDRIKLKIGNWSTRFLSQGGKEVFIKSVLQAIPTYAKACFLLPKSLCEEFESIFARYWWQKSQKTKGIHWCKWKDVCSSKEEGGLGYRDMAKFNIALLAKQG